MIIDVGFTYNYSVLYCGLALIGMTHMNYTVNIASFLNCVILSYSQP